MQLYNTKTRKIEKFKPLSDRKVKVYSCGPTVYNYAHIWNLRTYVFEDIVVRTLRFLWYNVNYIMNITDVEDKTIRDSQAAWENLKDFTEKYTKIFLEDIDKLNILKPDLIIPITTLIPEMVRMINTLLKRGNAYLWDDWSIYFDIKTFKKYWEFANLDMKNLKDWARVNSDEYDKESTSDFVLWKAWKESDWENFWEEEFEVSWKEVVEKIILKGRPWWHIECSACNIKYFGQQIDIHMWWIDLIFPHHQNEIAQTESCTHKAFSKYWLHSGHLMVDWKKMAKSAGNFYRLIDLEEKYWIKSWKLKAENDKW
jgi:cysteinyl-tRNA synthetase